MNNKLIIIINLIFFNIYGDNNQQFRYNNLNQSGFNVVYSFPGGSGGCTPASLYLDVDNILYGTTLACGKASQGLVYKLDQNYKYTLLHDFVDIKDGSYPNSPLISDGNFLYGTTTFGGGEGCMFSCGIVYKLDKNGSEFVLHVFNNAEGVTPYAGLTMYPDGYFYGTTTQRGLYNSGSFYKVNSLGDFSVLNTNIKISTQSSLTVGIDNLLYGASTFGNQYGTIFKMDNLGNITVLHDFLNGSDGSVPTASLVLAKDGSLYGVTSFGGFTGSEHCNNGCGTVFKINQAGQFSTIYQFKGGSSGDVPSTNLVIDNNGNLYGATSLGGKTSFLNPNGCGTIYKIDPNNNQTVIYQFNCNEDGMTPTGNLVIDKNNIIYGVTSNGGSQGLGVVYKFDLNF